ncbi:hypothetical protein HK098_001651 [Nowakowskiella sp. JEL0407]|nr:hypothetical protein HK098_001651 [Nowakowskiella sp. JEL0407]
MKHIERDNLYTDLLYRFTYVSSFIGFDETDTKAIKNAAGHLAPLVPAVVDAVYAKLFSFDITKKVFATKMDQYNGKVINDVSQLTQTSEQIKFRKEHLGKYLVKLVTAEYDAKMVAYLDKVALIHLKSDIKETKINVEYIHVNALMGYVETILIGAISDLPLDAETKKTTLIAFSKLLWIQNDLFAQYYVRDGNELPDSLAVKNHVQLYTPKAGELGVGQTSLVLVSIISVAVGFLAAYLRK